LAPPPEKEILMGLVALLHDTDDPLLVSRQLDKYRERGQRLAISEPFCSPPSG
jgi:hypothetical protein